MIRMSSQLETNLVSVERVKEYSDAQTEVGENQIIDYLKRTKKTKNVLKQFNRSCNER